MFSSEICEILQSMFFEEHLQLGANDCFHFINQSSETNANFYKKATLEKFHKILRKTFRTISKI